MRLWKQCADESRTVRKTGIGRRKVTSARHDRYLLRMAVNDCITSSRLLTARWSTATGELTSVLSIRRRLLHRGLRLQWAHEHRAWQADWQQVIFSYKSRFNLWEHEGHIRFRRYAGERCLPECVIELHSGLTPGVIIWGAISYHGRSNLLQIEENLNSKITSVKCSLQPEVIPFFKASLELSFIWIMHVQMLQRLLEIYDQPNTCNFFLGMLIRRICQLLSTDSSQDLVGRRLARDPRPAASKDELSLRIQALWNSLPQEDIQNLLDSMPSHIAARGGYTKY
ncbi:transposable element Tcb2 transposase [Trichonephila clavipes]|nr:transposable element Tcb2 transposase [Trichonephila clavipes]